MKKIIILISGILSIIFITGCTNNDTIGNTEGQILQYLNEGDFFNVIGNDNLTILDTVHIDNSKIVVFVSDSGQGYIVYEKNKKGDYIITENSAEGIEQNGLGVTNFAVRYNHNDGLDNKDLAYIVISNGSNVSTVEMSINNHIFNKKLKIGKPSMVLLKNVLSENEQKKSIDFDCKYFDKNDKELEGE
ncbi:hypothetical protein SAMN02910355_0859 [Terrisporobacter glycolicus]|nr:hypothetical protein SAMN02910355_0859 [Terrisporobacter glycolicus]